MPKGFEELYRFLITLCGCLCLLRGIYAFKPTGRHLFVKRRMRWDMAICEAMETLVATDHRNLTPEKAFQSISKWAKDAASLGPALAFQEQGDESVQVSFTMAPENWLSVGVGESNSTTTVIILKVSLPALEAKGDVSALIRSSSATLVDSLRGDIALLCDTLHEKDSTETHMDYSRPIIMFSAPMADGVLASVRGVVQNWGNTVASRGIGISSTASIEGIDVEFATSFPTSWQLTVREDTSVGKVKLVGVLLAATSDRDDLATLCSVRDSLAKQLIEGLSRWQDQYLNEAASSDDISRRSRDISSSSSSSSSSSATPPASADFVPVGAAQQGGATVGHRRRDAYLNEKARKLELNLDAFEGKGLEEQAIAQLNAMVQNSKRDPFFEMVRADDISTAAATLPTAQGILTVSELFARGKSLSRETWQAMLARENQDKFPESPEDLLKPPTQLPLRLEEAGLERGFDVFEGPSATGGDTGASRLAPSSSQQGRMQALIDKASPADRSTLHEDAKQLSLLTSELARCDDELRGDVLASYKDVLLSDNLLYLLNQANSTCVDDTEREALAMVAESAVAATMELGLLVKSESVRHLQTIHDVCDVAFALQQDEQKFLERMAFIKPRFDTAFLGYLNFAINEETASASATGKPSTWLQVLTIVKQGVLAEFERRYDRLLEPLLLHTRFEDAALRTELFRRFIDLTPPLELRYMRELAENMASGILQQQVRGEAFPDPMLPDKMIQLQSDVQTLLSDEIIDARVETFVAKAKAQGTEVIMRHRNPIVQEEMDMQAELLRREEQNRIAGSIGPSILDQGGTKEAPE